MTDPTPLTPPTGSADRDAFSAESPDRDPFRSMKAGTMGMTVFLISLSALFAASMVGWLLMALIMRGRKSIVDDAGLEVAVPPMPDLPPLPPLLWVSTLVILLSSATIQWAKASVTHPGPSGRGNQAGLKAGMALTIALGSVFLLLQTVCWFQWVDAAWGALKPDHQAYTFAATGFLVLSGLHAAHVVGGLLPMLLITLRAVAGRYTPESHAGVAHMAMYWHFLDVVWIVLFGGLMVAG